MLPRIDCWPQAGRPALRAGSLAGVLALACGIAAVSGQQIRPYVVGSNDVLAVTVFNQPQLSGRYEVAADGNLTFPLVGSVKAGGLTLKDVAEQLQTRLAGGYLKDPQVTVTVEQYRSQQVLVMGEVRNPGGLQLTGPITLIEALAKAGSPTDRAGLEVLVLRSTSESVAAAAVSGEAPGPQTEVVRVNLRELQNGSLSDNIALWPGDTIVVPRAEPVVVSGQVRSAGEYVLRRPMTVRQVLALAGGITERGSTRRIQIMRIVDGVETTIAARMDDPVQAGDTIVVRERLF